MFEQALFDYIKNNFTVSGFSLGFGFGTIPEDTSNPYITQFVLDSDGSRQDVCGDNQFTKGGVSFIQWNIYSQDATNVFHIKRELDKFISSIKKLTFGGKDYIVYINIHEGSVGSSFSNGLNLETLSKTLTYEVQ